MRKNCEKEEKKFGTFWEVGDSVKVRKVIRTVFVFEGLFLIAVSSAYIILITRFGG